MENLSTGESEGELSLRFTGTVAIESSRAILWIVLTSRREEYNLVQVIFHHHVRLVADAAHAQWRNG